MGILDIFTRGRSSSGVKSSPLPNIEAEAPKKIDAPTKPVVGATTDKDDAFMQSFSNSNITFNGSITGYDYDAILRDKQKNIVDLFKLADYFTDSDPIVHGIVKHVYVPYSTCSKWVLQGSNKKTRDFFEEYYEKIRLREKLDGIALEYWKYGQVYVYVMDGNIITLPVHKCKIGNVTLSGKPIVEYDCMSTLNEWKQKGYSVQENWIKDNKLETFFKGYPKEVQEAMNKGTQYAQLNPDNTFPFQASKESWQRYAVPFIAACLSALAKKALISQYETAILNLGIRSFVHVKYGDTTKGQDILPGEAELSVVRNIFSKAMGGFPLAVTNHLAEADILQPKLDDLFQWDKYREVNNDILSAGGISGIIVNGVAEDGSTFASAQVSMETACARINAMRDEFCEMMNRINERLLEEVKEFHKYNVKEAPKFTFMPLDMQSQKALRETCTELWTKGLVSTKTYMETNGYSYEKEKIQREQERSDKTDEVLVPRDLTGVPAGLNTSTVTPTQTDDSSKVGRPEIDNEERTSDPEAALRGKQPKPSNPEGSL